MFKHNNEIYFKSKYPDIVIPTDKSLSELILSSLKQQADNIPMLINGFTHREFNTHEIIDLIEKCASGFHQLGAMKGDIVAILLPNLPEYAVLFHGALLNGCIVSLVNPEYTVDEFVKTIGTVQPKFVVSTTTILERVGGSFQSFLPTIKHTVLIGDVEIPNTTSFQNLTRNEGKYPKVAINNMKDIAIIPFSSGTTGLFKGVSLTHHNVISNIYQVKVFESSLLYKKDSIVGTLPMFHIYGCMLFLGLYLIDPHTVVICPKFDAVKFLEVMEKYEINIAYIVPPIVLLFAKSPLIDKYNLSKLRILFSGAAPLSDTVEQAIKTRFNGNVIIKQGYGLTETSPATHITPSGALRSGSAGLLLPNQIAKIVSTETGKHLGPNERGELCIKGPNVMAGYFNNPKATNETIDSDLFLHTGDIAYVDDDGYYFIVDRVKELIKYKGFQVAPAELEGLLLSNELIQDVCVVGVPDGDNGEVPRAFVVLKPGNEGKVTQQQINDWLNPKISNYKRLRGGIFFISAIPKSATGKLLRKNLKSNL
ncbi:4-coumarate-CoA ligase [Tieghemostelium lacteum]|uniref:4-coumarate-CoA ligase n=1 Tax=Tieghemostelium lacteum TaxID=361077 RepID=A0A151ZIU1_TIELA|nr:4-coumarate-CoA ligase [Tieghemostelium lacteum]|eukprot:KYQ93918.1 4-coumarate-CoA ligase [Tieghemostelium lacteum]